MFWHIFSYRLKSTFRDFQTLFWTLFFPLILATFFGLVFSNLSENYIQFETVKVGVIESQDYSENSMLQSSLVNATQNEEEKLFDVYVYGSQEEAAMALKDKDISGYLKVDDKITMYVSSSGFNQSIMKTFLDWYSQINSAVERIITEDPSAAMNITEVVGQEVVYAREKQTDMKEPDSMITYFYALIAMTCLYGAFMGMREVMFVQANQSYEGARQSLAPIHKLKVFASSLCAVTLIQYMSILILMAYLVFVMKVSFADQVGYILLATFAGCCLGVSFGAMVSAIIKKNEGIKVGVIISLSMALSFTAGMMQSSVKYAIEKAVPQLAYLLPGNLIANTFYALYYYDTYNQYFFNVSLMFGMAFVFYLIVFMIMRRQQYASI